MDNPYVGQKVYSSYHGWGVVVNTSTPGITHVKIPSNVSPVACDTSRLSPEVVITIYGKDGLTYREYTYQGRVERRGLQAVVAGRRGTAFLRLVKRMLWEVVPRGARGGVVV